MCARIRPYTTWNRNRYTFYLTDIHGDRLVDIHNNPIMGTTDTQVLTTSWT